MTTGKLRGGRIVRLATRGSALALCQANIVRDMIRSSVPGTEVELLVVRTSADSQPTRPLHEFGDKGLFVKEIEEALLSGAADAGVHSLKDVPGELPQGLILAAVPQREDPRDALVSFNGKGIESLPQGSIVGTSSPRRAGQLLRLRPDLQIRGIRGNLDTRLRKLRDGEYQAIMLAMAGMNRLRLDVAPVPFPVDTVIPAAGQAAIAIETPEATPFGDVWQAIDDHVAHACVDAERAFVLAIGADCNTPAGCYCQSDGDRLQLVAMICSTDGTQVLTTSIEGALHDGCAFAGLAAEDLLSQGAAQLLEEARGRNA